MREQRAVRAQEGLLQRVLRLVRRADHVAAEAEQRPVVPVVEDLEGALVAAGGELGESGVREQAGSTQTHHPLKREKVGRLEGYNLDKGVARLR